MAQTRSRPELTQTNRDMKTYLFTFFATLSGVIVGVVAGVGMMGQVVKTQVASATDGLRQNLSSMKLASDVMECSGPTAMSVPAAAETSRAMTTPPAEQPVQPAIPPTGGEGGGGNKGAWVHYINTIVSDTKGDINQTGADSTNIVKSVNKNETTITNTNTVGLTNNNQQSAYSGSVDSERNTTAGDSQSGGAYNNSTAEFNVAVKN